MRVQPYAIPHISSSNREINNNFAYLTTSCVAESFHIQPL